LVKKESPETVVPKISQKIVVELVGTTRFAGRLFSWTGSGNGLYSLQWRIASLQFTSQRRAQRL